MSHDDAALIAVVSAGGTDSHEVIAHDQGLNAVSRVGGGQAMARGVASPHDREERRLHGPSHGFLERQSSPRFEDAVEAGLQTRLMRCRYMLSLAL